MDYVGTGQVISEARIAKGMTQKQLAKIIMVSDRTVSKWECGKGFPDPSLLESLSETLELPIADIVRGERSDINSTEDAKFRDAIRVLNKEVRKRITKIIGWILLTAFIVIFAESAVFFLRTNGDGIRRREWVSFFRAQYEQDCTTFRSRGVYRLEWVSGDWRTVITDDTAIDEFLAYVEHIELGKEHRDWGPASVTSYLAIVTDDGELPDSKFILSFPAFTISTTIAEPEGRHFYYEATIDGADTQEVLDAIVQEFVASDKAKRYNLGKE